MKTKSSSLTIKAIESEEWLDQTSKSLSEPFQVAAKGLLDVIKVGYTQHGFYAHYYKTDLPMVYTILTAEILGTFDGKVMALARVNHQPIAGVIIEADGAALAYYAVAAEQLKQTKKADQAFLDFKPDWKDRVFKTEFDREKILDKIAYDVDNGDWDTEFGKTTWREGGITLRVRREIELVVNPKHPFGTLSIEIIGSLNGSYLARVVEKSKGITREALLPAKFSTIWSWWYWDKPTPEGMTEEQLEEWS